MYIPTCSERRKHAATHRRWQKPAMANKRPVRAPPRCEPWMTSLVKILPCRFFSFWSPIFRVRAFFQLIPMTLGETSELGGSGLSPFCYQIVCLSPRRFILVWVRGPVSLFDMFQPVPNPAPHRHRRKPCAAALLVLPGDESVSLQAHPSKVPHRGLYKWTSLYSSKNLYNNMIKIRKLSIEHFINLVSFKIFILFYIKLFPSHSIKKSSTLTFSRYTSRYVDTAPTNATPKKACFWSQRSPHQDAGRRTDSRILSSVLDWSRGCSA